MVELLKKLFYRTSHEEPENKQPEKPKRQETTRDTVESILFAFVLAFMFRTFEAEAFVIPTGSMAPTLYGRHKETDCVQCGFHITVGASDEIIRETGLLEDGARLQSAICSNCGFPNDQIRDELAFNGDRILVNKYPYEFGDPDRWDVFVFKNPQEPETNYIKRLVGLPNETIRIRGGNVYQISDQGEQILRKDPEKQRRLQIPVYDDNHAPTRIIEAGWPERWASVVRGEIGQFDGWSESKAGWQADHQQRSYSISQDEADLQWLRYRHFFPSPSDWADARDGLLNPKARLVSDFCGYNTYTGFEFHEPFQVDTGRYWVRDLTINFDLEIDSVAQENRVIVELCEGTSWYRCEIDATSGEATLAEINSQFNERRQKIASAETSVRGPGTYEITFANVDDRLCLWVNGSLVDFGQDAELEVAGATENPFPTERDLTPVGIASSGVSAKVSNLLLERDIYYRAEFTQSDPRYSQNVRFERELANLSDDPEAWADLYLENGPQLDTLDIEIGPEQYVALGDNSPRSLDSRLWGEGSQTVPRKFLVGKAFFIYWPHGVPFMNDGRGYPITYNRKRTRGGGSERIDDYPRYTFPFYPQFDRMKRIR